MATTKSSTNKKTTTTKKAVDEKKKVQSSEKKETTTKGTPKTNKDGKVGASKSTDLDSSKSKNSKTAKAVKKEEPKKVAKKTVTAKAETKKVVKKSEEKKATTTKKQTVKEVEAKKEKVVENAVPMNNREISNFLNNVYSESALYMNYRSTPSFIDGLKNSGRKCLYTIKKRGLKSEVKVANFAGAVIDESNYIHGNVSMEGTMVTLSKDYCGSNNLPITNGVGAFGTRFTHEAAASRYIFIKQTDYMDDIFKKADDANLVSQEFEGDVIEPMFYTPTIPLVLVNGSTGVGNGFKTDILNRSLPNVIKMVRNKLAKKANPDNLFTPSWRGFTGTVTKIDDTKWEICGNAEIVGNKVVITELPISWDLQGYTQHLKSLRDQPIDENKRKRWVKRIEKYVDYSEDDIFRFEVKLTPEEAAKSKESILMDLGIIEVFTEQLNCIGENNEVCEFNSTQEIFEAYYKIKIKYLKKRITSEIARLEKELEYNSELYKFIMEVIKGTINMKLKKVEVEKIMADKGYRNISNLISIPLYSITADKAEEAKMKVENKKKEIEDMKKETPESLWAKDLDELEKTLKKEGRL